MKHIVYIVVALMSLTTFSQQKQKKQAPVNPYADDARELVLDGNDFLADNVFSKAEASYREAISLDPASVPAKYNAGNNYYRNEKFEESTATLVKASEVAQTKKEKHKAFHNLGNALYQQKNFEGAVEAYKNALRNDPTDEETRYNLALAKKEKEKNGGGGGGGDDENENQDQDKEQNQDKSKNEKNKDGEGDKQEGEDGEKEETDDKGEEEEKDKGEQKEDEKGDPQDKEKEQGGDKGEEKPQQPKQQAPQPGQLSPQQVRSLLEAMRNEEQKTQEKINAKKQKGAKIKTEKDW